MTASQFGIVGLGTMGRNLALNIESRGFSVAVWNLESAWVDDFLRAHPAGQFAGTTTFESFVTALQRPRRIMMMIPAGEPVDSTIAKLQPLLERGDVLIDGGNSWFEDTQRRGTWLAHAGIHFIGCGVSGGEEGARRGPSLMPGGPTEAWPLVRDVFEAMAARTEAGPCVTYVGPGGAGHFVKMVHNGIEYGDMQLIAETWDVLRRGLGLSAPETADIFERWNRGPLESYLVELTAQVCRVVDPRTREPLVDLVQDKAGQKGTGRWTAQIALDLAVAIPTIAAAIDARVLSSLKSERVKASEGLTGPSPADALGGEGRQQIIDDLRDALYAARICTYAQGMTSDPRGIGAVRLEHQPRRDCAHLERGMYHPGAFAGPRAPGVCGTRGAREPAARRGAGERRRSRAGRLAPHDRARRGGRHPGPGACRRPWLLRLVSLAAAPAEPDAGAARRLRRA